MGITYTIVLLASPNAPMGSFSWCLSASHVTASAQLVRSLLLTAHRVHQEATFTKAIVTLHALH